MSERLPQMTARQVERALRRDGWELEGQEGSHRQFTHPEKPGKVTIPFHHGDLGRRTVRSIMKQAQLTVDEFRRLL